MEKSKNVIVTGGAGFIGSHITRRLLKDGHNVVVIDDLSSGTWKNVACFNNSERFKFVKSCILKADESFFDWADVIIHQAASKKNICLTDPQRDCDVNAKGTLRLLQLAVKYNVEKFVHASTGSVYGETERSCEEDQICNPVSFYGVSKLAGEKYVQMFHEQFNLNTTILRYFHVYGSAQCDFDELGGVVAIFNRRLLEKKPLIVYGDGTQQRSFTHVSDVVEANIKAMTYDVGGIYNCASGHYTNINELAMALADHHKITEFEVDYEDWLVGDIKMFNVCNDKIIDKFGMRFKKELDFNKL
jgi:UDP-glucose 4-epimerase